MSGELTHDLLIHLVTTLPVARGEALGWLQGQLATPGSAVPDALVEILDQKDGATVPLGEVFNVDVLSSEFYAAVTALNTPYAGPRAGGEAPIMPLLRRVESLAAVLARFPAGREMLETFDSSKVPHQQSNRVNGYVSDALAHYKPLEPRERP